MGMDELPGRVYLVECNALVAGTRYREMFEDRDSALDHYHAHWDARPEFFCGAVEWDKVDDPRP